MVHNIYRGKLIYQGYLSGKHSPDLSFATYLNHLAIRTGNSDLNWDINTLYLNRPIIAGNKEFPSNSCCRIWNHGFIIYSE
jgi:hypothetical protein